MDVNNINDLQRLKAMAYDELAKMEQAKRNLDIINGRINIVFQIQQHDIQRMLGQGQSVSEEVKPPEPS